jgi:hypothetical protein
MFFRDSRCGQINGKIRQCRITRHNQDEICYESCSQKDPAILISRHISVSNNIVEAGTTNKFMYPLYPLWPSRSPKIETDKVTRQANIYTGTDRRLAAVALNPNWARMVSHACLPLQDHSHLIDDRWHE